MNIAQAKLEIRNCTEAYLACDDLGRPRIPLERQRPVLLLGAPGIGKTAIVGQVAAEMGIGLVSYSMTHHTRQSALGLPFITTKVYGGTEYRVSEYTMSEIVASVYDCMEASGVRQGILFLDEVNCVSETLSPSMLQFLQFKTFGRHRIPDGWVVVCAGNPPEYNNSVHEFDVVTMDRLKRIDVEPDLEAWKTYARSQGTHPAILSYLSTRPEDFYKVQTTVDGKAFVTARGWSDLSEMLVLYRELHIPASELLVSQYLQHRRVAQDFALYLDLYAKYREDYGIDAILEGRWETPVMERTRKARFDERLAVLGLVVDRLCAQAHEVMRLRAQASLLSTCVEEVAHALEGGLAFEEALASQIDTLDERTLAARASNTVQPDQEQALLVCRDLLEQARGAKDPDALSGLEELRGLVSKRQEACEEEAALEGSCLEAAFAFVEEAFGDASQELLVFVTDLTVDPFSAQYIALYGCDKYFEHNEGLLFSERRRALAAEVDAI